MKRSCTSISHVIWNNWKNALTASATILVVISAIAYISSDVRQFVVNQIERQMPIVTLYLFALPSVIYLMIVIVMSLCIRNPNQHHRLRIVMISLIILFIVLWVIFVFFDILPSGINISEPICVQAGNRNCHYGSPFDNGILISWIGIIKGSSWGQRNQ